MRCIIQGLNIKSGSKPQQSTMVSVVINLQSKIHIPAKRIKSIALKSCQKLKLKIKELSFVFVGPQRMRSINRKFLGHDNVTDVITFVHGEIIICPAQALKNAKFFKNTIQDEIVLCAVHGLLHLAGYDDHTEKDRKRMRFMEAKLMGECEL